MAGMGLRTGEVNLSSCHSGVLPGRRDLPASGRYYHLTAKTPGLYYKPHVNDIVWLGRSRQQSDNCSIRASNNARDRCGRRVKPVAKLDVHLFFFRTSFHSPSPFACFGSSAKRTLAAKSCRAKGFWMKWAPSFSTPRLAITLAG